MSDAIVTKREIKILENKGKIFCSSLFLTYTFPLKPDLWSSSDNYYIPLTVKILEVYFTLSPFDGLAHSSLKLIL